MNFEGLENVLGMFKNDKRIAVLGEVTKEYKSIIGINQDVYYASIDIDLLLNNLTSELHKYMNISKFPSVNRELNFLFNNDIHYSEIEILLFQNSKIKKLISMSLSDVYIDKKLPEGKKSYTLSFRLMDNEKTLTEKEIQSTMNKIQNIIENKFIATLRS